MSQKNEIRAELIYTVISKKWNIRAHNGILYVYTGTHWKLMTEQEACIGVYQYFTPNQHPYLKLNNIKDALERIKHTPAFQLEFSGEMSETFINTMSGVFDIEAGKLLEHSEGLEFSYVLDFQYRTGIQLSQAEHFKNFVESVFPDEPEVKAKLLLQMLGYCLSDCTKAKAAFFLIGASNSGKSTMLDVLKRLFPENAISAIPLNRLENRFNIARLDGKKLNICTEISEKSFAALDIFKQLTSNEMVTAEHKGKTPFEFRIRCKSINAGNMLPDLDKVEGMEAVLNRMVLLFFPVSIKKENQDMELSEKLWMERNEIFSMAIDELVELKKNNFVFAEPTDSYQTKEQLRARSTAFDDFIKDNCEKNTDYQCHIAPIYEAFQQYCNQNFIEVKMSRNFFSQKIARIPGVKRKKIRIEGKSLWGVTGLRLKIG